MADFEKMIPFIFHFAAGVYGRNGADLLLPVEKQWELARRTGWSDDPHDPGGATMVDVTLETYRSYCRRVGLPRPGREELRAIGLDQWRAILKEMYWDVWMGDCIESQGLAHMLVDWGWASGNGVVGRVQRLLGVPADGKAGPVTLRAVNGADVTSLFGRLQAERERFYRACKGSRYYLKGWLRRLYAIRADGTFDWTVRDFRGQ